MVSFLEARQKIDFQHEKISICKSLYLRSFYKNLVTQRSILSRKLMKTKDVLENFEKTFLLDLPSPALPKELLTIPFLESQWTHAYPLLKLMLDNYIQTWYVKHWRRGFSRREFVTEKEVVDLSCFATQKTSNLPTSSFGRPLSQSVFHLLVEFFLQAPR